MANLEKDRRRFLSRVLQALGGLAVFEATWVAATFLGSGRGNATSGDGENVHVAGPVERFEPGSVTAFRDGEYYLARLPEGSFLALHRKCTHLGCTVPWNPDEQRFACPCHASAFDIHGDILSSPAPRPLDLFAVQIENGIVKVDTAKPIRRGKFEPLQATPV
jgi:cytochrome b6-f complex iron-sulfur subunit